jgi:ABC-type multidrug transport system permease subunit
MKSYAALIRSNLRLMLRDRTVLFFSFLFPLTFFFLFAQAFHASVNGGAMSQVIAMVLIIGVLGNGFFGAGMRTVQDRETGVLRRFKVAPISAAPVIVASLVSGLVAYLPTVFLFLFFGNAIYHAPYPSHLGSLIVFISLGLVAFRAVGMIVASVVNSAQEAQIVIQILYLPMLFLSGATFPVSMMPVWVQTIAQFLPATYLFQGVTSILLGGESVIKNLASVFALLTTLAVCLFIGVKLFRWEKEEKIAKGAKWWILAVLAPFLLMGVYQTFTKQNIEKAKILERNARRHGSELFQHVKIFVGDGSVVEDGAVLIKDEKIAEVFMSPPTNTQAFEATVVESSGKTLLPGLIDMRVHIGMSGGVDRDATKSPYRRLAAYLYSGITAVCSAGESAQIQVNADKYDGARLFPCEPAQAPDLSLSGAEAAYDFRTGNPELLNRSLLRQVGPADLIASTREATVKNRGHAASSALPSASQNLLNAFQSGVPLIAGSDAGNILVLHGPTIQHELELWVKAGIPPAAALEAATYNAARALHADNHIGLIKKGYEATFILLDGDPLADISNLQHINAVYFRGGHINRSALFDQFKP